MCIPMETILFAEPTQFINMTEREMFEKSFQRPRDYFKLHEQTQWHIDNSLGILDWKGKDLSKEDIKRFKDHYEN